MPRSPLAAPCPEKPRASVAAPWRVGFRTLTLMSCVFFARLPQARAQSANAGPSVPDAVPVTLAGARPGLILSIRPEHSTRYAQRCEGTCNLMLVPGMYRVGVVENGESSSRRIKIREPARLTLTPPNPKARDTGVGLVIGGAVLGGLGSVVFLYGVGRALPCAYADEQGSDCPKHPATLLFVGLGGMAAGLALAIPGMVLVLKNLGPSVNVDRGGMAGSRRAPALSLQVFGGGAPIGIRVLGEF